MEKKINYNEVFKQLIEISSLTTEEDKIIRSFIETFNKAYFTQKSKVQALLFNLAIESVKHHNMKRIKACKNQNLSNDKESIQECDTLELLKPDNTELEKDMNSLPKKTASADLRNPKLMLCQRGINPLSNRERLLRMLIESLIIEEEKYGD
ncbi:MAG: hypothetical protein IJ529_01425 [Alphaproteobacteria bacterium]|nr:hypothetical protein [Alphaproteobacteria bacterium]MBR1599956.1 hypothetical protein [Alphaproteobacteria bacterium]MBR1648344.1 hypothetical protein [Alphaproteobacteria bacterium]